MDVPESPEEIPQGPDAEGRAADPGMDPLSAYGDQIDPEVKFRGVMMSSYRGEAFFHVRTDDRFLSIPVDDIQLLGLMNQIARYLLSQRLKDAPD